MFHLPPSNKGGFLMCTFLKIEKGSKKMTIEEIMNVVSDKPDEQKKEFALRVMELVSKGFSEKEAVSKVKQEMFGTEVPALGYTKSGSHSRNRDSQTELE